MAPPKASFSSPVSYGTLAGMKRPAAFFLLIVGIVAASSRAAEPEYSAWTRLLQTYYDPAHGMDYAHLKARDARSLETLRQQLGRVNVAALNRKQQLAYWINVYNINTVATIVENYPLKSIRDISTDPIRRLNVFSKERIPFNGAMLSLDDVENKKIREGFHDPRIHFAINCAAKSCPPIRAEAYRGDAIDAQLDDQARKFLANARFAKSGEALIVHVTKIVDWFGKDFDEWGAGRVQFIRRFVTPDKQKLIGEAKENVKLEYDEYDWDLNDWKK
jgi:hypothetical protein